MTLKEKQINELLERKQEDWLIKKIVGCSDLEIALVKEKRKLSNLT